MLSALSEDASSGKQCIQGLEQELENQQLAKFHSQPRRLFGA